jgi:hypothetical protein
MAMTETPPDTDAPSAAPPAHDAADVEVVLGAGDHKTVGRLWIALSSLYLVAGLVFAVVAGIERIDPGSFVLLDDAQMYAQLWSLGRETLLLLGVVPLLVGIATYVVPLQVGAATIAFPRGAAAAFWCWLVSGALLVAAYVLNGGPGGGREDFTLLWTAAMAAVLLSLVWALLCVATTVIGLRVQGMTLDRVPVSAWSFLVFAMVALLTLPILVAESVVAHLRVRYGDLGDPVSRLSLLDIADGVSIAPGVLWVAIPVLGLAAELVATHAGYPLRRRSTVLFLIGAFGALAFGGHVLSFLDLRPAPFDNAVMVMGLLVVPVVILGVLALAGDSLRRGTVSFRSAPAAGLVAGAVLLLASLVIVLGQVEHILGFIESVSGQNIDVPSWLQLTGTAYHDGVRVLVVGAALIAGAGALVHWGHKLYGRALDDTMGAITVGALAVGVVVWGIADVVAGMLEQLREPIVEAAQRDGVDILNAIAMVGAALAALGALVLLVNLAVSTLGRRGSVVEPWRGTTLEWATASPPSRGNFPEPPVVTSADPLADQRAEEAR